MNLLATNASPSPAAGAPRSHELNGRITPGIHFLLVLA